MFNAVWKCAFRTSRRPYANPHIKNRIVTRATGTIDSRVVMYPAPVTAWSSTAAVLGFSTWSIVSTACFD